MNSPSSACATLWGPCAGARGEAPPQLVASADAITAKPIDIRHDFHYRGDSRGLLTAVAASYGLTVIFDDSFPSRRVRFDLENADFATAMAAVSAATKSFSVALEDKVLFASADNPDNHRLTTAWACARFTFPGPAPQDLNDLMNALRTLFEFKFVSLNAAASTNHVRGPQTALEAATEFLGSSIAPSGSDARSESLPGEPHLHAEHRAARPGCFNLFNIPAAALAALGGQNIQSLINQLVSSGRHQPGRQSDHFRSARAIARPAEFHLQPAARDLRRRAHVLWALALISWPPCFP
jgi:hypothetical protein